MRSSDSWTTGGFACRIFWRSPMCWTGCPGRMRRIAAAWTVKRCGLGASLQCRRDRRAHRCTARRASAPPYRVSRWPKLRGLVLAEAGSGARRRGCAGAVLICAIRSLNASTWRYTSALWANCCAGWGLSRVQPAPRTIPSATSTRRRLLKNFTSLVAEALPLHAAGKPDRDMVP